MTGTDILRLAVESYLRVLSDEEFHQLLAVARPQVGAEVCRAVVSRAADPNRLE